jgi:hypothetical protein
VLRGKLQCTEGRNEADAIEDVQQASDRTGILDVGHGDDLLDAFPRDADSIPFLRNLVRTCTGGSLVGTQNG